MGNLMRIARRRRWGIVGLLLFLWAGLSSASAAPADPLTGQSPSFQPAPEEGADYNEGDWGVNDQRGAATYTIPIVVPPGRNGMQPSLALRYSSQAALRGGIAAGWTLDIPSIERDRSLGADAGVHYRASLGAVSGRLLPADFEPAYPDAAGTYRVEYDDSFTRFQRRTQGTGGLTTVSWTAMTPDGVRHHFGAQLLLETHPLWLIEKQQDPFGNTIEYFWSDTLAPDGTFLQKQLDRIEYSSNSGAGLVAHARVVFNYAPLKLCSGSYLPPGATWRQGTLVTEGARELAAIKTFVRDDQDQGWRRVRDMTLTYRLQNSTLYEDSMTLPPPGDRDEPIIFECNQNLLRYLTQIDVTGYTSDGSPAPLPPRTFTYNWRRDTTPELIPPGYVPFPSGNVQWDGWGQHGTSGRVLSGKLSDLVDIDGDGIADYVTADRNGDVCRLSWRRGLYGGGYEGVERHFDLPTAAWYADWKGEVSPVWSPREGCTIGGQIAYRDYRSQDSTTWLPAKGLVSYHFLDWNGDGIVDLLTNVWATVCHWTYNPHAPTGAEDNGEPDCNFAQGAQQVPQSVLIDDELPPGAGVGIGGTDYLLQPLLDDEPPPGDPEYIPMTPEPQSLLGNPYGSRNHPYIWRVFPGTGDPNDPFVTESFEKITIDSPTSMAPTAGDERLDTATVTSYSVPPLFDLDGDGFLDVVDPTWTTLTNNPSSCTAQNDGEIPLRGCNWTVYLSDGTGSFPLTSDAHVWSAPTTDLASDQFQTLTCAIEYVHKRATVIDMQDVTGDGLVDLVVRADDGRLKFYTNYGEGFRTSARDLGISNVLAKTQTDCNEAGSNELLDGARGYRRRLLDLDQDGLLDMVWFVNQSGNSDDDAINYDHIVKARFNIGGRFGAAVTLPEEWLRSKRLALVQFDNSDPANNPQAGSWHVKTDFTDITGDGLPDLTRWDRFEFFYYYRPGLPYAPDLLDTVENGRGLQIEFEYAPSTDAAIVDCTSAACADSHLPHTMWLVSATEVDAGFGAPVVRTEYTYRDPHYLSSEMVHGVDQRSQFAGFGMTRQTTLDSAGNQHRQLRTRYDYTFLGINGGLVEALQGLVESQSEYVYDGSGWDLHSHKTHTYSYQPEAALPATTLRCITAQSNMTTTQCMAQNNHVSRTERQWVEVEDIYVLQEEIEGIGSTGAVGDRHTQFTYEIRSGGNILCGPPFGLCDSNASGDADDYRVRTTRTERRLRNNVNSYETVARTETNFSLASSLPRSTRVYHDDATYAQTSFVYDAATGNLLSTTKPMQRTGAGGSGASTDLVYDSHQLYPSQIINELGHTVFLTYDVGIGALLSTKGPNRSPVDNRWEQERWAIDGLGRTLSYAATFDDGTGGYELHPVSRTAYDDWAYHDHGLEPSITQRQLRDAPTTPLSIWLSNQFTTNDGWDPAEHLRLLGDFDGSGSDDVVGFGDDKVEVALSSGNQFQVTEWAGPTMTSATGWDALHHPRLVGDFNGDGRDDVVGFGGNNVKVGLSTGSNFNVTNWSNVQLTYSTGWRGDEHPRLVGDFDGDGRDDVVGFGNANVWVGISTGAGFDMSVWTNRQFTYNTGWRMEDHPRLVGDFNGDGRDDVVGFGDGNVWVGTSTGSSFDLDVWTDQEFTTATGWQGDRHPRLVGDFNGDGRDDVVGFGDANTWVGLSVLGVGFELSRWSTELTYNSGWRVDSHPRMVADLNGDGQDDVLGLGGGWVGTAMSTGHGFSVEKRNWDEMISQSGWYLPQHPRLPGDFDGDGRDDVVGFGDANVWVGQVTQDVWLRSQQDLDGIGRVLRDRQFTADDAAETSYTYGELSELVAVTMPDPREDSAVVSYTYEYDSLGRVTHFTRPDGSGSSANYEGLTHTVCEDTGDGSGGCRTLVHDPLGRLVEVREHDVAGTEVATTLYTYDGNDNLAQITNADGDITTLDHDWASNRVAIRRGTREWLYTYDLNGNVVEETPPLSAGGDASWYRVGYSYDDLDRVTSMTYGDLLITTFPEGPPPGNHRIYLPLVKRAGVANTLAQPLAEEAELDEEEPARVTSTVTYVYDEGQNGRGRLSRVTLPFAEIAYGYDPLGRPIGVQRTFALDNVATLSVTRRVNRSFNALGQLTDTVWDDDQRWQIRYDERGLVDRVRWYNPTEGGWQDVADYTRALSGLPITRDTSYGQRRSFTYDMLARPASDLVLHGPAGCDPCDEVASRHYTYTDSGDLSTVTGHTAGVSADAAYTYDAFHRLLTATGPNGYEGAFTYSPAGNVLSADIDWNGSLETRHVTYQYGSVDPQAVDRLLTVGSGEEYATFDYDLAGNMIGRHLPGDNMALYWNALGHLRAVSNPGGGELYYYDHQGQRLLTVSQAEGVRFWFDEREIHYELDGSPARDYLHLSAGGPTLARVENGTEIELQYADSLQNLMFALDDAGNVVASFLYGPFGEVVYEDGAADHRRQFNGKENDRVTGLRYYGYRYYDPLTLRWNSADPLYRFVPDLGMRDPQRMNLYTFSLNNPVRYYDPDGRDADLEDVCSVRKEECRTDTKEDESKSEESTSLAAEIAAELVKRTKATTEESLQVDETGKSNTDGASKPKVGLTIGGKTKPLAGGEAEGRDFSGDWRIGQGSAELTVDEDGVSASATAEGAGATGCAILDNTCAPQIWDWDKEACLQACVGGTIGVGVSAQAGSKGLRASAKSGVSVSFGIVIRERESEAIPRPGVLADDPDPPSPRLNNVRSIPSEAPRMDR